MVFSVCGAAAGDYQEYAAAARCRELLSLYKLGRTEVLEVIGGLYDSLSSAWERAEIITGVTLPGLLRVSANAAIH